ncbi:MAG: caspase family protein [Spirulina sp. SIO3F2]|nr:caspase family protein [Spirulina sp. SIO3F2]
MAQISRRHFLQAAGAALTTAGISRWQTERYGKVLAQSTPRKLALLVGINDYIDAPLGGCVNDAILQRQLLIHRFGFNPKDILMLFDGDATREGMLTAFEEHLIKQTKPGDVVVYHFSGHGSQVLDPQPTLTDFTAPSGTGLNGTFVPIDATLPETYPAEGGAVKDIMGHTLFLLMSAIKTENFTAVLDSCFSGSATRSSGGLVHRARAGGETIEISALEKDYQAQWLSRLGWSHEEFVQRYQQGIANGIVLASTQRDQYAVDEQLNGFTAGAFTFRLTQRLWQMDTTPAAVIDYINSVMPEDYEQNPQVEAEAGSSYAQDPIFFVKNSAAVADALVVERPQDKAVILLVGIEPGKIRRGQVFQTRDRGGEVAIAFRDGLAAVGSVTGQIQVGDRLRLQH